MSKKIRIVCEIDLNDFTVRWNEAGASKGMQAPGKQEPSREPGRPPAYVTVDGRKWHPSRLN